MRLLIDESIPEQIEPHLSAFSPSTVRRERLKGLRNGVLLRAAVARGFTVVLTADQSLQHQQNLNRIGIAAVIVTVRNRMTDLLPILPAIVAAIASSEPGAVLLVP